MSVARRLMAGFMGVLFLVLAMMQPADQAHAEWYDPTTWFDGETSGSDESSWYNPTTWNPSTWVDWDAWKVWAAEARKAAGVDTMSGDQRAMAERQEADYKACVADYSQTSCWSCSFVDAFAATGFAGAEKTYSTLAPGFVGILHYLFLVWIAIQALKMFSPDGNGLAVIKGVALKSLLLVMVLAALTAGADSYPLYRDWILVPILDAGGQMSIAILNAFGAGGDGFGQVFGSLQVPASTVPTGALRATFETILEVVGKMQQISGWGFAMGLSMIQGANIATIEVLQLLGGLGLLFFFGIAIIAFPFYIIDLLFRAILLTALAPIAIASLVFGPTRRVTIAALMGLIQSAGMVAILGAVVSLVGAMMTGALIEAGKPSFVTWACDLIRLNDGVSFGFSEPEYWYLACAGILAVGAMSKARSIVGALIGGFDDGNSLGSMAGGLARSGMMFTAKASLGIAGLAVSAGTAGVAAGVGQGLGLVGGSKAAFGVVGQGIMNAVQGGRASTIASTLTAGGMSNRNEGGGE